MVDWGVAEVLWSAVLAFAVTALVTPVTIVALRRWQVLDVPNERSSHAEPTPRGGGLGVAAGVLLALSLSTQVAPTAKAGVVVAGVTFALLGLLEDFVGVPALRRLLLMFVVGVVPLPWLLEGLGGGLAWRAVFTLAVLAWIVSYVNAYNFMDGINGLAVAQAVIAGAAWYAIGRTGDAPDLAALGLIVAVSAVAFAPFNFPRARVFLGDSGSYFLGAVMACAAVIGLRAGLAAEAVLSPLVIFGADTGMTLVRRVARGDRWHEPHREHVYQQLTTRLGGSHARATGLVGVAIGACAALGALSLSGSLSLRIVGDTALLGVVTVYLCSPGLLNQARRRQPTFA
ncbi:MAG: glycosyltransferase family 4 protein [Acidimicrobiales bacterium]